MRSGSQEIVTTLRLSCVSNSASPAEGLGSFKAFSRFVSRNSLASLPVVVVLPAPCRPAMRMTAGGFFFMLGHLPLLLAVAETDQFAGAKRELATAKAAKECPPPELGLPCEISPPPPRVRLRRS